MEKQKRKDMLEEYKRQKTIMGVIRIKNEKNGKLYVAGFPNLKNKWHTQKAQLLQGTHMNLALQKEWKEFGAEACSYEVLEEKSTEDVFDVRFETKQMEKMWLEKLAPYGDKGYNRPPKD